MRWALMALAGMMAAASGPAEAKTPGKTYCFLGVCHRVKSLEETQRLVGKSETLHASHYNDAKLDRFNPSNITSSGAYFHASRPDNAASPIYPDGTILLVWNPRTRQAVVVRVNNAGPYYKNRKLDLSRAAAVKLGFGKQGVAQVVVKVLKAPSRAEARYRRGRTYPAVAGYLGAFASLDAAARRAGLGGGSQEGVPADGIATGAPVQVAVAPPVRKPLLLAALARAETTGKQARVKARIARFNLADGYQGLRVRGDELARARSPILVSLSGAGPSSSGVSRKQEEAHRRIAQVVIGKPRLAPPAWHSRAGGTGRHRTYVSGGVKSLEAAGVPRALVSVLE
jgi:rare lipoprotein A